METYTNSDIPHKRKMEADAMPRKRLKIKGFGIGLAAAMREKREFWRDDNQPDPLKLAAAIGEPHSAVYRWLEGQEPRARKLFKIAAVLGVDAVKLSNWRTGAVVLLITLLTAGVLSPRGTIAAGHLNSEMLLIGSRGFWRRWLYGYRLRLAATGAA